MPKEAEGVDESMMGVVGQEEWPGNKNEVTGKGKEADGTCKSLC